MRNLKKFFLAALVCGALVAYLMFTGLWSAAVVKPIETMAGVATSQLAAPTPTPSAAQDAPAKATGDAAADLLAGLRQGTVDSAAIRSVITAAPTPTSKRIPNYNRDAYGAAWIDVDQNGCDTRNDILNRDLINIVHTTGVCVVAAGILADPYTGKTIDFTRGKGTSSAVQIDHIVPLGEAWGMGAYAWTDTQRAAFANDPDELLAVDGPSNTRKSDKGPGQWLPANAGYRCTYIAKYSYVVAKYKLAVSTTDKTGIAEVLKGC